MSANVPGSETLVGVFLAVFFVVVFFLVFFVVVFFVAVFLTVLADACEDPRPNNGIASKVLSSLRMSLLFVTIKSSAPNWING